MRQPSGSNRCFSYGGRISDLKNVAVWKFDVLLPLEHRHGTRVTCYVKHSTRSEAFQALFAQWPKAKIFGSGLPLTEMDAEHELGRRIDPGDVAIVHDLGEFT